mgnify:CR=1 FL=1
MNKYSFPPIVLTHITKDNALFHGACITGINQLIDTHNLSNLTAVPVQLLLDSNELTQDEIYWIESIAGLSINPNDIEYGDGYGDGYGDIYGYNNGDGYRTGDGYGYVYGHVNGDGYVDGDGDGYETDD